MLVLCHGCFDLLHPGHIEHLEAARRKGDSLAVSVSADFIVRKNKGPNRPIFPAEDRVRMLKALRCVDQVWICDGEDATNAIHHFAPAWFVKGIDYKDVTEWEREACKLVGARIGFTQTEKRSTSDIIERIRA